MRDRIICRFDSEADLNKFKIDNNFNDLEKNVVIYNVNKGVIKTKRTGVTRETEEKWKAHWVDMPEYVSEKQEVYATVELEFEQDLDLARKVLQQNITDKTISVWFPKLIQGKHASMRVVGGIGHSKYPIYVVSKGRKDNCSTSEFLTRMEQYHYVVVEPNEVEGYISTLQNKYCKILPLDMQYKADYDTFDELGDTKSKGPGAARNFCWEHSMKKGYKWHWVMDDNANEGFMYMHRNRKIKCRTASMFLACEDFVDRYDNIAIAGLNYSKFCLESNKAPAYITNTRIYSFLLIRNDIDYRWRGRYNEDTDLSLRVLKDGWCTVQFNAFLAGKATTQKIKGGNTDEFYAHEGTLPKSQMLKDMHPDVSEVVYKFSRWHHQVDYSGFKQELKLKEEPYLSRDYNLILIDTEETKTNDTKKYLEEKYLTK